MKDKFIINNICEDVCAKDLKEKFINFDNNNAQIPSKGKNAMHWLYLFSSKGNVDSRKTRPLLLTWETRILLSNCFQTHATHY